MSTLRGVQIVLDYYEKEYKNTYRGTGNTECFIDNREGDYAKAYNVYEFNQLMGRWRLGADVIAKILNVSTESFYAVEGVLGSSVMIYTKKASYEKVKKVLAIRNYICACGRDTTELQVEWLTQWSDDIDAFPINILQQSKGIDTVLTYLTLFYCEHIQGRHPFKGSNLVL